MQAILEPARARRALIHYENFPVVGWFLPAEARPAFRAIYAYCRAVDDLGDEAGGDRSAHLAAWEEELDACYRGSPRLPLFRELRRTIDRFSIPRDPFARLIEANRIDQRKTRHATWGELVGYCAYSANPVGHLVLHVIGAHDAPRAALSDATCTALQLTNFWQDVAVDWGKGRVYLPAEDLARFGATEGMIRGRDATPAFRALMAFEVERTRALFRAGLALALQVDRRYRTALLLFTRGGWGILNRLAASGYDPLNSRPAWSRWEMMRLTGSTWWNRDRILKNPDLL